MNIIYSYRKMSKQVLEEARGEGNRIAMAIKASKTEYYVSDATLSKSTEDEIVVATTTVLESVKTTLGKNAASYMIITSSLEKLVVVIKIHDQQASNINAKEWLTSSILGIGKDTDIFEDSTDTFAKAIITVATPFKLHDSVRGNAFAFLRKKKLLIEESSDEEEYSFEL
jgi:hypothetical protein